MKKAAVVLLIMSGCIFQFCSSSRKARKAEPSISYTSHVQPIISGNCSPCHIPPEGRKKPLNTYDAARESIDDIIERIQKTPDQKGFMPFKHSRLPDSTIQVFVKWKNDGLLK